MAAKVVTSIMGKPILCTPEETTATTHTTADSTTGKNLLEKPPKRYFVAILFCNASTHDIS